MSDELADAGQGDHQDLGGGEDQGDQRQGPRRPRRESVETHGGLEPQGDDDHDAHDAHDDHDYVDLPPHSSAPRWLVALLVIVGLVVVTVGIGRWWWGSQVNPGGPPGEAVTISILEGTTTKGAASVLANKGVITNSTVFNIWVGGKDLKTIQAGTYQFRTNMSFQEAVDVLNAGPDTPVAVKTTKVTIPEGYTVDQIVARIVEKVPRIKAEDLHAALDGAQIKTALLPAGTNNYEGLLFPATYEVKDEDGAVEILTMMASEMETRVEALGINEAMAHISQRWGLELDAYDMVIVASLIQYEAAVPADAPKIGAVTYNRLQKGMPLQYDATSAYEARLQGLDPAKVDYQKDTPYNTRVRSGLPPTPIAAPGELALEGAFQPADGPWLYFVVTDVDEVTFTESYDDFLAAKQLCIQRDLGCG